MPTAETVSTSRDVVFVDCETNGIDPRRHEAWEVAAFNLTTGHRREFFVHVGDVAQFMSRSQPIALRVGKFLDRYPLNGDAPTRAQTNTDLAALLDVLRGGAETATFQPPIILGSKPTFDMDFLTKLYQDHKYTPDLDGRPRYWHHHPIDLGSYAAGVLGIELGTQSLSAETVARMCGVEPGGHSAGGDVTSGAAAYLLLRQAARAAQLGEQSAAEWLAEWRTVFSDDDPSFAAASAIEQFGPAAVAA